MAPSPAPSPRERWIAALVPLLLVVTHVWPWPRPTGRVLAGLLPDELAWRMAWMLVATGYVVWFTRVMWTEEDEA